MIKVPFNDLARHHSAIRCEIDNAIKSVIDHSAFVRGPHVEAFEAAFSKLTHQEYTVSCSNGTTSLYIALRALGAGNGDEVIVPGMSWISTSETVTQTGAKVVFCDISPETHVIDIEALENAITPRTVGIIPVHLYGHPAPMKKIMEIAAKHSLWVVEDCAQAHLAMIEDRMIGSFGDVASYSFYPGKNLGAMGDAGALTTNSSTLAIHMTKLARHGGLTKGQHEIEGLNSRLDGIQAAILNVKIPYLKEWTNKRRRVAARYLNSLVKLDPERLKLPSIEPLCNPSWHLFVVKTNKRAELIRHLNRSGIQSVINYPRALPFLQCYADRNHRAEEFPNSYNLQESCLSLPIFPEITDHEIELVVSALNSW